MPRILEGSELEEAIKWMAYAIEESNYSPCLKDKRGVVIVKEGSILGVGHNRPPEGFQCSESPCEKFCRTYSVHAEMVALGDSLFRGSYIKGSRMYHARVEDGLLIDSRKPRCADCSKHILEFGIGDFVLKHAEGYTVYDASEFHRLSIENFIARAMMN